MALKLKQSTAVDVLIGPFVDLTDGATAEPGESPSVKLSKNGQALGAKNDATTPVHDADGYYNCELDATDTNTVGTLVLTVAKSANALPVRHEFQVVEEATYDFLYASGATPIADINAEVDTALSDYDPPTKAELDTAVADVSVDEIQASALADLFNTDSGTDYASAVGGSVVKEIADNAGGSALTEAGIADAVWDEARSGHVAAGSFGEGVLVESLNTQAKADVNAEADTALSDYDPPTKAELDTAVADVSVDEIQASALADLFNTDSGTTYGAAVGGSVVKETADNAGGSALTEAGIADAVWDEARAGHVSAGSFGEGVLVESLNTQAKADVNAEADTALTDYDPPTKAELDAGLGALNDLSAAEVNAEVDSALADYDPPTKTEMDSAFTEIKGATWAAGTDTLEAIRDRGDAAWTTASVAGLSTFDPTTDTVTVDTNNDKTGYALTSGERTSIADALLDRDMSSGADSGSESVRTVRQALRPNRNKSSIAGGTLTVYKEDDSTASWTADVTTSASDPISEIDPADA